MGKVDKEAYIEAIKKMGQLHGNMQVLSRLNSILKDANSSMAEAERLIQSDGAIAGTIVSLSNSALYGFGEKSESISDALNKVGYDQALSLVGLALSKQVFMKDLDTYGISADDYWRYSYFVAVFMEDQAARVDMEPGDAYLLGLLHAMGKVVINELLVSDNVDVLWDRFLPSEQWEVSMVGFPQEVAGSILLKNWEFDDAFCKLVRMQTKVSEQVRSPTLSLLDFAKMIAINLDDPMRLEMVMMPGEHIYLKRRRYRDGELELAVEKARGKVENVLTSLGGC